MTNGAVNGHLISGHSLSTERKFGQIEITVQLVKVKARVIIYTNFEKLCPYMAMSLNVLLMVYTYLNLVALPEHLRMLLTSIIVTNS